MGNGFLEHSSATWKASLLHPQSEIKMKSSIVSVIPAFAAFGFIAASASAVPVTLELALLVDVSGSVDATEYGLQRDGYKAAFQSAAVQNLIANAPGGIAVTYIEWSGTSGQSTRIGWTHLTDAATSNAFGTAVGNLTRTFDGNTAPGSAINFAVPLFNNNGFEGGQLVIDVSGDGTQNEGASTSAARDAALAAGITRINGLAIGDQTLVNWYTANIQGGTNAFTIQASTFGAFNTAVQNKIVYEISGGNPAPDAGSTLALFVVGLLGLVGMRRRFSS